MAISRAFTDLGEIRGAGGRGMGGCKVIHGQYSTELADTYLTATQCVITFDRLHVVEKILGLYIDNVGFVPKLVSRATNIVTIALYWSGGAGAAMTEVTNGTTINVINVHCVVVGK